MRIPVQLKSDLKDLVREYDGIDFGNPGQRGAVIGHLNKACGGDGERHILFEYLFGVRSSKELSGAQWYALYRWIDATDIDGVWLPAPDFEEEANLAIDAACNVKRIYEFD